METCVGCQTKFPDHLLHPTKMLTPMPQNFPKKMMKFVLFITEEGLPVQILGEVPEGLIALIFLCPICSLKLRNKMHGFPKNYPFGGPKADALYQEALAWIRRN